MHPFWETSDVVSEAISLLSKADQTRLARVNATLWENSIPHIWKDVPKLECFLNLFPSDLWNRVEEPSVSFSLCTRVSNAQDSLNFGVTR